MHRIFAALLLTVALGGCSSPLAQIEPPPPPSAVAQAAQASPALVPTHTPAHVPGNPTLSSPTPAAPPSLGAQPSQANRAFDQQPAATPGQSAPTASNGEPVVPLPVASQAAALLPEYSSDLDNTQSWDRYTIDVTLRPETLTVEGRQTVEFTNRSGGELTQIYFHLYPNHPDVKGSLEIGDLTIAGQPLRPAYEQNGLLMRLDLPQALPAGASTTISMVFRTGTPRSGPYGGFNYQAGAWNLASFYPTLAIIRPDGWDTERVIDRGDLVNSDTALYQVRLVAPPDWTLVTSGSTLAEFREEGHQRVTYVSGPQRDFFVVALQGHDQVSAEVDGVQVTSYYRPEHAAGGRIALDVATRSLQLFNQRYGRYPLNQLEVVEIAATTFAGLELPGVILINQNLYTGSAILDSVVAHEVGHQWWYSQVGNDVRREAWLDEALASYSEVVYHENVNGAGAVEQTLDEFRARYQRVRSAGRDTIVAQSTNDFASGTYYGIVYGKAVLFFHALRIQLGDEAFFRFLQTYYAEQRYRRASAPDLVRAAETSCGCEIDSLYNDWILSTVPVAIP